MTYIVLQDSTQVCLNSTDIITATSMSTVSISIAVAIKSSNQKKVSREGLL